LFGETPLKQLFVSISERIDITVKNGDGMREASMGVGHADAILLSRKWLVDYKFNTLHEF
jgi:hypothetical protein